MAWPDLVSDSNEYRKAPIAESTRQKGPFMAHAHPRQTTSTVRRSTRRGRSVVSAVTLALFVAALTAPPALAAPAGPQGLAPIVISGLEPASQRTAPAATGRVIVGLKDPRSAGARALLADKRLEARTRRDQATMATLKVPAGQSPQSFARSLQGDPSVAWATPDYIRHVSAYAVPPNDPAYNDSSAYNLFGTPLAYSKSWWLRDGNVAALWPSLGTSASQYGARTGGGTFKVAVVDTGFWMTHPDKGPGITAGKDEFQTYSSTTGAYATDSDVTPADPAAPLNSITIASHGTCVAGEIAAGTNNGIGVASVGYDASVSMYKVEGIWLEGDPANGYPAGCAVILDGAIINAIYDATDAGCKVISMSLGGASDSPAMQTAINYAWSHGVVVTAATGNDGVGTVSYPGADNNVVGVGSYGLTSAGTRVRSSFSNYGTGLDIMAPGEYVWGLTKPDYAPYAVPGYNFWSGTSMATPAFAGMLATVWRFAPALSNQQIVSLMLTSASPPLAGQTSTQYGSGYADVNRAYSALKAQYPLLAKPVLSASTLTSSSSVPVSWTPVTGTSVSYTTSVDGGAGSEVAGTSTSFSGLADGAHVVSVQPHSDYNWWDASSDATAGVTVDTHAPVITGLAVADGVASWSTSDLSAYTAEYRIDGGPATPASGGTQDVSGAGPGPHTFYVRATDAAGNVSSWSSAGFVLPGDPFTTIQGVPAGWTNADVTFSLTASGTAPIQTWYDLSGGAPATPYTGPVTVSSEGTTTVTYDSTGPGGTEPVSTARIRIDKTPPVTTAAGIPATSTLQPATVTLSASDGLSGVAATYYRVDGGAASAYTGPIVLDTPGSYTLEFWSVDNAGNEEPHHTSGFGVTALPPAPLTAIDGVPSSWVDHDVVFSLTATGEATPLSTTYALGGGAPVPYSTPVTVSAEGTTVVSYATSDSLGQHEATKTAQIRIDKTPPVTTSDAHASYLGQASISLSATDNMSGVAGTVYSVDAGADTSYTAPVAVTGPGTHSIAYWSVDAAGNTEGSHTATFTVAGPVHDDLFGPDRYDTAIAASRSQFPTGSVSTVVIATGRDFPDALSAGPLAGAYRGPVLLTPTASLPVAVIDEIARLGATKAVIVGGTGAVSSTVSDQLTAQLGPGNVDRVAGSTRYGTAAEVAARIKAVHPALDGTVFIATGLDYPDALAAGADAWKNVRPVLLVKGAVVPSETLAAVASLDATREVVLGGTGAAPDSAVALVRTVLAGSKTVLRIGGVNRYDTAAQVAIWSAEGEGLGWEDVGMATGQNFADALGGGPVLGKAGGVMLLTRTASLPPETAAALAAQRATVTRLHFLGGTGAISDAVRIEALSALR